jgi:hypothetical protein
MSHPQLPVEVTRQRENNVVLLKRGLWFDIHLPLMWLAPHPKLHNSFLLKVEATPLTDQGRVFKLGLKNPAET